MSGSPTDGHSALPPLNRDRSFWGMAATQFLGAFNDNLFKQLILLLATPTAAELAAGQGTDVQGVAQIIFAAAFLIFSGVAGYFADRHSKRTVIVLSKVAEIVAMLLGLVGFLMYGAFGLTGLMFVLFLMGTQSAFFGPAKYGILPEMLRASDLPRANGIFLMLTFLAIIFGTAAAGFLLTESGGRVWVGSILCVGIAVVGTFTSFLVRRVPIAQSDLTYTLSSWGISRDILRLLARDRHLMWAIVVVSIFWMVGGIVQQTVNALGKTQLHLTDKATSVLAASIGFGIALGCALGGYLSRGRVNPRVVVTGAVGLFITLVLMALPNGPNQHLLGYRGSIPVLIVMGTFTGMFIVPVQVALQSRPPREEKGRMIATMNQFSWIGIILGAIVYQVCIAILDRTGWPRCLVFGVAAVLMAPVVLFYRPQDQSLGDDGAAG